jgi:type 1 glutamine amidotransferase
MRACWTLAAAAASACVLACGSSDAPAPGPTPVPPAANAPRVLMITATAGFRHDAIPAAVAAMRALAAATGEFVVSATEDVAALSPSSLASHHLVMFALTTGELPLSNEQKAALLGFVDEGGGFIGVHSAADTLYEWSDYGRLVGAYFREHPWTQQGTVIVEDPSHAANAGVGAQFSLREEFYTFRDNPRPRVHVLLRLDAASVGASGDYPLAWSHSFGRGRAYYNALGHFAETWSDPRFQAQLRSAIRWAARR